ncbi:MAG: SLBB domain-containing protein [Desulfovibrio sp.]|jgi:Na+-translocating ferredoxin:NAD+ oxidoreductase RnfC subunit|nr:SLBB domain-containing protein [Desulfovibrio sp.]
MDRVQFIEAVRAAGVVGEGGAGFPAHVKYAGSADTVIANGCECEPLLHTDRHHMERDARAAAGALAELKRASGAGRGIFALKKKQTRAIPQVREACGDFGLEMALLEDFYPAGDEQILVRELTGRSVPALGIPLQAGCMVANVGTLVSVDAALRGASVTHKTLTVTGEVRQPGIVRVPVGTSMDECLAAAGGALVADPVFILGGPMMGRLVENEATLKKEHVAKTDGGLIALPRGHCLHLNASQNVERMRRRAAAACIQCRFCSDLCPRMLIGQPFETHRVMRVFGAGAEMESEAGRKAHLCSGCGVCEHYACPMRLSPRRVNQAIKQALNNAKILYDGPRGTKEEQTRPREYRKIPLSRLASRLGVSRYMGLETPDLGTLKPDVIRVPLGRHIGAPALPLVLPGQKVRSGECIGEIPEKSLGARAHAGINGVVVSVDDAVTIRSEEYA